MGRPCRPKPQSRGRRTTLTNLRANGCKLALNLDRSFRWTSSEFARAAPAAAQGSRSMRLIVGTIIVLVCVFGGYAAMGGKLLVLWQPFEFVIILGAAVGAFIIGNT